MNKFLKKYIRDICKIYGCKVKFSKKISGGLYWKGNIVISTTMCTSETIDVFCHELGHFRNDIENKFPIYHRKGSVYGIEKMGKKKFSVYALRAELYTEKVGIDICKIWFPNHKYKVGYKNTAYWRGFFYGYYCE